MKVFHCDSCRHLVFFENVACVRCGHVLAFLPDAMDMAALEPEGELWRSLGGQGNARYRLCSNHAQGVCNWAVPAEEPDLLCRSCRLTRVIPDTTITRNHDAWRKLEAAKRRVVYSLVRLGLPLRNRQEDPEQGLAFEFLSEAATSDDRPVLTGHHAGVITINIAEADDAEREKRRQALHEPYRTLLGHLRHEVGHYYWDVLLRDSPRLDAFRGLFGDEREDYAAALKRHYDFGPQPDWQSRHVSAYASTHPWEDWAETWAHYLHMTDALETAAASGVIINPPGTDRIFSPADIASDDIRSVPFDALLEHWLQLAYMLNNLNRSLGLPDGYPFVLAQPAMEKLRFTHRTVRAMQSSPS